MPAHDRSPDRPAVAARDAVACVATGAALQGWGVARGFTPIRPAVAAVLALVFAACLWAGWRAVWRHRALARGAAGPYLVRHGGLVWAVGVWSGVTYGLARPPLAAAAGPEEGAWRLLLLAAVTLPIMLWGGLWFAGALAAGLGTRRPGA